MTNGIEADDAADDLPQDFGARLRALRLARGIGLGQFAHLLHYSKGHVSRIENGIRAPTVQFARQCDAELEAEGILAALVPLPTPGREPLLNALSLLPTQRFTKTGYDSAAVEKQLEQHLEIFGAVRELGQIAPPSTILPMVTAQAQALRALLSGSGDKPPIAVATLAARVAEYAGWMAQESGDDRKAVWWTDCAVEVASAAGDGHVASYALLRRGLIALYRGDAADTVALAREAQSRIGTPRRILGLAAQREAQGHALAGDHDACMRALERAREFLARASDDQPPGPVIGTTHVLDPVGVVTGWCLYDLGRPRASSEIFAREIPRILPGAIRLRTRFGARQALACAAAGELEQACSLTRAVVADAICIDSATIRSDIGRLARTLRRWHSHPAVRALEPALCLALHPAR
ncbi:XRE family transcriptional regulator [Amycolatopsis balhimycina DSM 5908]|uniref:XRE family transcriptional regulator n=1 Tax=Amycolatopsis balhimycina DSM 5908 TaxID=1081091 RepID=A0A428WAA9_AMYBA|nr:helix-turn-helix transcriptional regulator [Amycolatopsis balhimycina]RSM40036.1 XRE family transcriptional regulator [Amycolatopsis balhimycina DSM 5908]